MKIIQDAITGITKEIWVTKEELETLKNDETVAKVNNLSPFNAVRLIVKEDWQMVDFSQKP